MKFDTIEHGELKIMRYRALNGTWYRIAYYDGEFRFVHISQNIARTLPKGKTYTGKKYLKYFGEFIVDSETGTITII